LGKWNPKLIADDSLLSQYKENNEEEEEISPQKEEHREIMEAVSEELNNKLSAWASNFTIKKEDDFKLYQSRDGYITTTYMRWLFGKAKLYLECGLWKEENEPLKFYVEIGSSKKSEKLSYKFSNPEVIELLERNNYDNNSGSEEKPDFIKEIVVSEITKKSISELSISEIEKIKSVIEQVLNT
ncbi:hypothetical protein HYW99_03600, partial [Candidatus Woesearchaeota archaeon]|nr:hypothetical protein [Candidatus Woesearchaeota archaeon]